MQFEINKWNKMYKKVHFFAKMLKDARHDYDGNLPVCPLSKKEVRHLEKEIKKLLIANNEYLKECHMELPRPLWKFNINDKTTWASDPSFKYRNLILLNKKRGKRLHAGDI